MPHLLLIAMHFPPSRASGVYRPLAMANYFVEQGWHVSVITVGEDYFRDITGSSDPDLLSAVNPAVRVIRAPMAHGHLQHDIRRLSWPRANFPKAASLLDAAVVRAFPDRYTPWIPSAVAAGLRLHAREHVDLVLATGNPWSAFETARLLRAAARIPYVLDYRDSWTLSQFTESDSFEPSHPAWRAERRVISNAKSIVFVNEPMRAWHADRYPAAAARMIVVENGWDPGLVTPPPFRVPDPGRGLRIGSVGTITEVWPHEAAWEGWRLARNRPELDGAALHLYGHLGFFPHARARIAALLPQIEDGVVLEGPVAKTTLTEVYDSLDVIALIIPPSRFVTAGKVYEAMSIGKPIVSIHSADSAASGPLRGYPLWYPTQSLAPSAVATAFTAAAAASRTMTPDQHRAAQEHAQRYARPRLLEPFERRMRVLAGGRREVTVAHP